MPLLAAVVRKPEAELASALDRLIAAGLLFRQGVPPHATYLFKHALVQDAAYGTLLREPRRALHARIADTLESHFEDDCRKPAGAVSASLHRGWTDRKGRGLWGKAGQRSLERSALWRLSEQLTRALDQIASLPATPALRREQIRLQVALITPLIHVKGYAAPERKAAAEQARLLIEQAEALGEPPEDPLLLFSVLYGFWVANYVAFDGDVCASLRRNFWHSPRSKGRQCRLMIGHRLMGMSLLLTGDIAQGRAHFDRAIALYDPAEHRALATRFGQDVRVTILCVSVVRPVGDWLSEGRARRCENALKDAREIGHAATLMYALFHAPLTLFSAGITLTATAAIDEACRISGRKGRLRSGRRSECCTRLPLSPDWQSRRRSPGDHLRYYRTAVNGINAVDAVVFVILGDGLCGTRSIQRCLALHRRSDDSDGNNQGEVVGGRGQSRGR